MAYLSAFCIFLLFFSISSSSSSLFSVSQGYTKSIGVVTEQREFDYFLLALQWPGTFCQKTKHCCAANGCCRSNATNDFTIHGLWTDYNDGTWPACCSGIKFDIKQIKPLLKGLQQYWPTLSCNSVSNCHGGKGLFWAHEEKHGTCSYPVFKDEYSYFLATLNLYFKYNVTEILSKEGYVASNTEKYPLGGIVSAIQNSVKATPKIVCRHGAIKELHICFYKTFEPRDCVLGANEINSGSSCPKYVSLPERVPLSLPGANFPWSSGIESF
ncbi:ribonuclease T2 [Ranunculus cassubicifolius]